MTDPFSHLDLLDLQESQDFIGEDTILATSAHLRSSSDSSSEFASTQEAADLRLERKRRQNRESASRSRISKKQQLLTLKQTIKSLRAKNAELRRENGNLRTENDSLRWELESRDQRNLQPSNSRKRRKMMTALSLTILSFVTVAGTFDGESAVETTRERKLLSVPVHFERDISLFAYIAIALVAAALVLMFWKRRRHRSQTIIPMHISL